MTDYTEGISGFKLKGSWKEVVAHGERISQALKDIDDIEEKYEEDIDGYNEWRPKFNENLSNDVSNKTAEQASMSEDGIEEKADNPNEEIKQAEEHITKGTKEAEKPNEAATEIKTSMVFFARALAVMAKQSVRNSEEMVYKNLMTVLSPYYFDNNLVSANIKKESENTYVLEININDDELKSKVSEKMEEYDDAEDWSVETHIETENIENAEGIR